MLMTYLYCFPLSTMQRSLSKHFSINFLLEKENGGHLSLLDINIFRENGKFVSNVYQKRPSVVYILIAAASYLKPVAFKIHLGTWQLPKLLSREICVFSNVCQQIIAEEKLS